jgi:hypothetical protein
MPQSTIISVIASEMPVAIVRAIEPGGLIERLFLCVM